MKTYSERRGKKSCSWKHGLAVGGAVLVSSIGCSALATSLTTLHVFCSSSAPGSVPGCADGEAPEGHLHFDSQGNLYGTAFVGGLTGGVGGSNGNGVVYKITPDGAFRVVYAFKGGTDGSDPWGGVVSDGAGNLYGVGSFGGTNGGEGGALGNGVVYKISPSGVQTVLYSFCQKQNLPFPGYPNCVDGSYPAGGLHLDGTGNIFGTAQLGGQETGVGAPPPNSNSSQTGQGNGLVFQISPWGSYTVLHTFTGMPNEDGSNPWAKLTADPWGNIYGTTFGGGVPGISDAGNGVVFQLSPTPNGSYAYNVRYQFTGYADGSAPIANVRVDQNGNLFGSTLGGGDAYGLSGFGVAYELPPNGKEKVLHTFTDGADGGSPAAGLIEDCSGNWYGAATAGGNMNGAVCSANGGCGVIYKLSPNGTSYTYTVLYTFAGGNDGANPYPTLIADDNGNLYGTATLGGNTTYGNGPNGNGTVFKLSGTGFNASCRS